MSLVSPGPAVESKRPVGNISYGERPKTRFSLMQNVRKTSNSPRGTISDRKGHGIEGLGVYKVAFLLRGPLPRMSIRERYTNGPSFRSIRSRKMATCLTKATTCEKTPLPDFCVSQTQTARVGPARHSSTRSSPKKWLVQASSAPSTLVASGGL